MGDKSGIEWTDATWNPVTGCSKVSPGCAHCYAETLSLRWGRSASAWTPENAMENVVLHPERLDQPLKWKRSRMIFVNSMSDLFHERLTGLPDDLNQRKYDRAVGEPPRPDFIAQVFAVMSLATQHTFQVLTKRPRAMGSLLSHPNFWMQVNGFRMEWGYPVIPGGMTDLAAGRQTLANVWLGTSIENKKYLDRALWLRHTPARVRFISAEPLLGSLRDLELRTEPEMLPEGTPIDEVLAHRPKPVLPPIDWVIVGGESGNHHRKMNLDHARELRDACKAAGTAFFFKQVGGRTPKAGGKLLDGEEWNEMPRG